jgi:Bax protein
MAVIPATNIVLLDDLIKRFSKPWHPTLAVLALCAIVVLGWWLSRDRVPDFGPLPDFAAVQDTGQMKALFYGYLTPIAQYQNERIQQQRQRLLRIHSQLEAGDTAGFFDRRWLRQLAMAYEIDWDPAQTPPPVQRLVRRVDVVPLELTLVQAAKESGWGRSRFAVEANNLFGQWCYQPGCGVVPANRSAGATHEVQRFDTVAEAIRRYMNNLNTHERYATLREIREELRASGRAVTGMALAKGLIFYSERREQYVQEVRAMIQSYREFESRQQGSS